MHQGSIRLLRGLVFENPGLRFVAFILACLGLTACDMGLAEQRTDIEAAEVAVFASMQHRFLVRRDSTRLDECSVLSSLRTDSIRTRDLSAYLAPAVPRAARLACARRDTTISVAEAVHLDSVVTSLASTQKRTAIIYLMVRLRTVYYDERYFLSTGASGRVQTSGVARWFVDSVKLGSAGHRG